MSRATKIELDTRELIVQLSRGNAGIAHALAQRIQADLSMILNSDLSADSSLGQKARQTRFAIEEVLGLMDQSDLGGAWDAARDAAREWRVIARTEE